MVYKDPYSQANSGQSLFLVTALWYHFRG